MIIDPESKYIILAPHPDDELHMAFSWIREYPDNAIIAILTTGSAGIDESNRSLELSDLVAERYKESILGLYALNIKSEQILFFGFMDGRENRQKTIIDREARIEQFSLTIEYLDNRYNPQFFLAPSPSEVHIDHEYLGHALLKSRICAKRIFSCYPKSINMPHPDYTTTLSKSDFEFRNYICSTYYKTQSFLCQKLNGKEYKTDRYWWAKTITKKNYTGLLYTIYDISDAKDERVINDVFDKEASKKNRAIIALKDKYHHDSDPWNYATNHYEHIRMSTIAELLKESFDTSMKITDIGCGNGKLLSVLHESGFSNLHGSDIIQTGSKHFSSNIPLKIEDMDTTFKRIYKDSSHDIIILSDVVYYIHFLEFKRYASEVKVPYIIFCGGEYSNIRPYLLPLLEYYTVIKGKVLEYSKNTTFFLVLKLKNTNNE